MTILFANGGDDFVFAILLYFGAWVAAGLLAWYFFSTVRSKRLIQDLPTAKASGVFIGLVELKGTAESEIPIYAPLSGIPCVWYVWTVEEEWKRTRVVTRRDKNGNVRTVTETYSGWDIVGQGEDRPSFYLLDDSGAVRINPAQAKIDSLEVFSRDCQRGDPLYDAFAPPTPVAGSLGRRRLTENAIPLHHDLYVVGRSRVREDVAAPEIAWDPNSPLFLISVDPEEAQIYHRESGSFIAGVFLFVLLAAIVGGPVMVFLSSMKVALPLVVGIVAASILLILFLLGLGWIWVIHYTLVELRNRTLQAKSNLEVELMRRHALIPQLVATVAGMKNHERELSPLVVKLRAQAEMKNPFEGQTAAAPKMEAVGKELRGVIERYPELKSSEFFVNLHRNLVNTEQRIALARNYYNDLVTCSNNRFETFPDGFFARLSGLKKLPYWAAEGFDVTPLKLNLGNEPKPKLYQNNGLESK